MLVTDEAYSPTARRIGCYPPRLVVREYGNSLSWFPASHNIASLGNHLSSTSVCLRLMYEARCEQGSRSRAEATVVECSLLLSLLAARRLVFVAPARPASLCPVTPVRQTSLSADSGTANRVQRSDSYNVAQIYRYMLSNLRFHTAGRLA